MTTRYPGLVLADWRTRLLHDHPALFPDLRVVATGLGPTLVSVGWPSVGEGWRALVERACARIADACAGVPAAEVAILGIEEKWGTLRLTVSTLDLCETASAAVDLAVDLAEARSLHVCETCGAPGRFSVKHGWYATVCAAHADGYLPVRSRDLDLQVTTMIVGDRTVRMARRYEVRSDRFIALEPPIDEDS
ncbi:hypothetical protein CIW48_22410 [Methylobacterium sp. P1-11]|nr:hypothetical protein CIW48_22410 [Methylobacterium sp. P1-11]